MGYRWGIAATGGIAAGFADAMRSSHAEIHVAPDSSTVQRSLGWRSKTPVASICVNAAITSMARNAKPNSSRPDQKGCASGAASIVNAFMHQYGEPAEL